MDDNLLHHGVSIDLNVNNDDNSPMQSLDQSGVGITITRAASQQMMHLSLANTIDKSTPLGDTISLCGTIYDNGAHCINRILAFTPPSNQTAHGCGIWIGHFGATEQTLLSLCQQHSNDHNKLFILLDLSHQGRMDLRAARLDQQQQLQPVTISMVEA